MSVHLRLFVHFSNDVGVDSLVLVRVCVVQERMRAARLCGLSILSHSFSIRSCPSTSICTCPPFLTPIFSARTNRYTLRVVYILHVLSLYYVAL